jgi:cytochrome c peroxidase
MASGHLPFSIVRLPTLTDHRAVILFRLAACLWLLAGAAAGPAVAAEHEHAAPVVLAPGYSDLEFTPPAPGSYRLPPLGAAADGAVLDSQGRSLRLHELLGDGPVLLSFIYTSCSDVNGCPLATHVLAKTTAKLAAAPEIADRVRLISLSFDPAYDTPAVMRRYGEPFQGKGLDWRFLTTRGGAELDPILKAYDQWVIRDYDEAGNALGTISHLLRVYLIDREKQIRNIYSVSFLHADTLLNDLMTLLAETGAE